MLDRSRRSNIPASDSYERLRTDEVVALLKTNPDTGLSRSEAADRFRRFGPNEVPEKRIHPLVMFIKRFWGLTAWMLELIIILSWILHRYPDIYIVGGLLIMNSLIGFLEEQKAARVVETMKAGLQVKARVLRDGAWLGVPSKELVPGDVIRVRAGDFMPADGKILSGTLAVDQSALTGESLTVDKKADDTLYSGSMIRQGESTGVVIRTGAATNYGKTTVLVQIAKPKLHMEEVVTRLVKWLLVITGGLLSLTLAVSLVREADLLEILPLMLVLLLSAIPVALPVMFTVSMAVGARDLARKSVLITRLSATEDAAAMDVLCVDKTGTLTLNELAISHVIPLEPYSENEVILYGALASQEANRDPLDLAFINLEKERKLVSASTVQEKFIPFDPATRKTEAVIRHNGQTFGVMKGAVAAVAQACGLGPQEVAGLEARLADFSNRGYKTLAVARTLDAKPVIVGLVALSDRPRPDSAALIKTLHALGVSVKMLTGDALPIAIEIARGLGIGTNISRMEDLKTLLTRDAAAGLKRIEQSDGFAEVYPEDKYLIVRSLQAGKHVVGMTGDGVNDAPALKQAEVGIAVSSATDVAKASASAVLTSTGLSGIVELVTNGRKVYQRIATWVLNKIMRTILKSAFIVGVFLVTGDFVISAFVMVLLLLMTDFIKISLSTDRVRWSRSPDTWNIRRYINASIVLGVLMVLESAGLLGMGLRYWHLAPSDPMARTLSFEILLFSALMSIFVVRERRHFWSSWPSRTLLGAILLDMLAGTIISTLGIPGVLHRVPLEMSLAVIGYSLIFSLFVNDLVKTRLLRMLGIAT